MEDVDVVCVYDNDDFSAPLEYTFDLLLSTLGISHKVMPLRQLIEQGDPPADALLVSYARDFIDLGVEKQIHIYASDLFREKYLKPDSLPETPLKKYDGLPVIYSGRGPLDWVRHSASLIETNIDIIASSFFMVSRYEEVLLDAKDEHDRSPAWASLAFQEGFLDRPIVNDYVELLWGWIQALAPGLRRKPLWPDGKDFAVCLTHDVDSLQKYRLSIMVQGALARLKLLGMPKGEQAAPQAEDQPSSVERLAPRGVLSIMLDWSKVVFRLKKDPHDTFDYMLDLEGKSGFKSSLYFMAGGDSGFDNRYSVTDRRVVKLIRKLEARGCEVGLHPSYNSYNRPDYMVAEKAALDGVVSNSSYGCRQHYLRWKTPETWRVQEGAGLFYDATLAYADHAGFRCGFCLPFTPFDIMENRALNIWELPLTVQEGTLKGASYQNLSPDEAYSRVVELVQAVRKCQGVFVLLWHNSSFDPGGWAGWKEVYERVVYHIREQNAWVTSGRGIIEWWEERR